MLEIHKKLSVNKSRQLSSQFLQIGLQNKVFLLARMV